MNELDEILLEQLHNTRKNKKFLNKMKKVLDGDGMIEIGMSYVDGRIQFFESMIEDKNLLKKKIRRKKTKKNTDLLARSSLYELYRNAFFISTVGYSMFMDYFSSYMSHFRKDKG